MIGRLPHPEDANRCIFVTLFYDPIERIWQPGQSPFHETEPQAMHACVAEVNSRSQAMQINIDRLFAWPDEQDAIRIRGIRYGLHPLTGVLEPLAAPTSPDPGSAADEAFADAAMACMETAQANLPTAVTARAFRLVIERLSQRLADMEPP